LARCAGCTRDAEALEFDKADHALLRWLQSAKQMVESSGANRGPFVALDRDVLIQ
jgi:hypothetical protein